MVSKREGENYVIGENSCDKYPITIPQTELCEGIVKLEKLTAHCHDFLEKLHDTNVLSALSYPLTYTEISGKSFFKIATASNR